MLIWGTWTYAWVECRNSCWEEKGFAMLKWPENDVNFARNRALKFAKFTRWPRNFWLIENGPRAFWVWHPWVYWVPGSFVDSGVATQMTMGMFPLERRAERTNDRGSNGMANFRQFAVSRLAVVLINTGRTTLSRPTVPQLVSQATFTTRFSGSNYRQVTAPCAWEAYEMRRHER